MTEKTQYLQEEAAQMLQNVTVKTAYMCERNKNGIPYTVKDDGFYNNLDYMDENPDLGINWWTNGFFGGILWQMYVKTRDQSYLEMARVQEKKLDQCLELFEGIHDSGRPL